MYWILRHMRLFLTVSWDFLSQLDKRGGKKAEDSW